MRKEPQTTPKARNRRKKAEIPMAERLVYTIVEAGELLNLSERTAYDAAKRGDIPTIRIGARFVVPKAALEAMLAGADPRRVA